MAGGGIAAMEAIRHFLRLIAVPTILVCSTYGGFWVSHGRLPEGFHEIVRWLI